MKQKFKYNISETVIYKRTGKEKKIIDRQVNGTRNYYYVTALNGQSQLFIPEDELLPQNTMYKINNKVRCKSAKGEWVGTIKSCFTDVTGQVYYTVLPENGKRASTVRKEDILKLEEPKKFKYLPGTYLLINFDKLGKRTIQIKEQIFDSKEPEYIIKYVGFNEDDDILTEKLIEGKIITNKYEPGDVIKYKAYKYEGEKNEIKKGKIINIFNYIFEDKYVLAYHVEDENNRDYRIKEDDIIESVEKLAPAKNITFTIKNKDSCKVKYKTEKFLNPSSSMSTGSVVCLDAIVTEEFKKIPQRFIEISDCGKKIRLHQIPDFETKEDFIHKLELLNGEIQSFINYLKNEK